MAAGTVAGGQLLSCRTGGGVHIDGRVHVDGGARTDATIGHSPGTAATRRRSVKEEAMKTMTGVVLILLGLIGILYGGLTFTTKEKVVDLGPIEATRDKKTTLPLPPIAGAVALIGGVVLVATGRKS